MAIYLRTGVGGAGKTLNTLEELLKLQEDLKASGNSRKVYTFNITFKDDHPLYDQVKDWISLSAKNLTEDLPLLLSREEEGSSIYINQHEFIEHGSIILIDEAQDLYPTRSGSSRMPEYMKFFERHRHAGLDFYIITQKARQIDVHLRELINEHIHYERPFGMEGVRATRANKLIDDPSKKDEGYLVTRKPYPKKLYNLYQSSVLHTHKKKLPKLFTVVLPLVIVLIIGLGYLAFKTLTSLENSSTLSNEPVKNENNASVYSNQKTVQYGPLIDVQNELSFSHEIIIGSSFKAYFLYRTADFETILELSDLFRMGVPLQRFEEGIYLSSSGFVIPKKSFISSDNKRIF